MNIEWITSWLLAAVVVPLFVGCCVMGLILYALFKKK